MKWRFLCLLFLAACGDALVDGAYPGEPFLRVEGVFRGSTGEETIHSPHIGIVWPLHDGSYSLAGFDNRLTTIQAGPLASTFSFEIWDLPPALAFDHACGVRMALGTLAVYDDVNQDGRVDLTIDDGLLGVAAPDKALGVGVINYLAYVDGVPREGCEPPWPSTPGPGFHVLGLHQCQTWQRTDPFVEVHLFPPSNHFGPIIVDDPMCFLEP